MNKELLQRITIDSNICHGKACFRHMRWSINVILGLVSSEMSFEGNS